MSDFMEDLGAQVHHDIMACIGCNDCLLACPLPESRNVTISELNYAVLSDSITDPNVVEFLSRCTQCQQCVPVCPADLSRADIVLWNKLKVESVAPNRVMPLQVGEQTIDSQWTIDSLTSYLVSLPIFADIDPAVLRRIVLSVTVRRLAEDEVLAEEGDYYDRLLVVLEGELEQSAVDANGIRTRILTLDPGQFHGYMSVMGHSREPFTISAVEEATVVEMNKATALRLMQESDVFREKMEALYESRAVSSYIRSSPVLAGIDEQAVQSLLDESDLRVMQPGEVLYHEGDPASDLYFVRDGFLRVARRVGDRERVIQYFREGDVCGLAAVLLRHPQTSTASANTRSEVIVVPEKVLNRLLDEHPEVRLYLARHITQTELHVGDLSAAPQANTTQSIIPIEGLLDEGIIQGTEVLMINTSICTNCNNCSDACGRRHGYSRLDRSGMQMGELLFPTACRHCEDPVCLLCSVNGIIRLPDGEIRIVPDNCIGCGACAERCPYGNIQMHFRDGNGEAHQRGGIHRLISFLSGDDEQEEGLHRADIKGKRVAAKCDLCAGYEDYACVTACPVGAAMRVNPVEIFGRPDIVVGLEQERR